MAIAAPDRPETGSDLQQADAFGGVVFVAFLKYGQARPGAKSTSAGAL
jgi:hypothetical protein